MGFVMCVHSIILIQTCCVQHWQSNIGAMDIPGNLFICINLSIPTTIPTTIWRSCIIMLYTPKSQCKLKNSNEVNACLHIISERWPTPTDISGEDYFRSMLQVWDGDTIELRHLFSKEVTAWTSLCNTLTLLLLPSPFEYKVDYNTQCQVWL